MNKFLKTCFALFIAINFTGIGVNLFIQANLGSDTITVFTDGLSKVLNTSIGDASKIYNVVLLAISLLIARKHVGWCTIIYALSVGFSINLYGSSISSLSIGEASIVVKLIYILIAQICFGLTYALLIKYRNGMNQIDAIAYYVCDKLKLQYVYVRTGFDVIVLIVGFIMGGVIGVGSIIAMSTTGILVNKCLKILKFSNS